KRSPKLGVSMTPNKSMHAILTILCLGCAPLLKADVSTQGHGKGHIPMSQEQRKKIEKTWQRIVHVKTNHIGVGRIQEHEKKYGINAPELQAVLHHEEFVKSFGSSALHLENPSHTTLPSSVNNTTLPSFPPIGDQQNEGSCVAWGSTYYQATHELGLLN